MKVPKRTRKEGRVQIGKAPVSNPLSTRPWLTALIVKAHGDLLTNGQMARIYPDLLFFAFSVKRRENYRNKKKGFLPKYTPDPGVKGRTLEKARSFMQKNKLRARTSKKRGKDEDATFFARSWQLHTYSVVFLLTVVFFESSCLQLELFFTIEAFLLTVGKCV